MIRNEVEKIIRDVLLTLTILGFTAALWYAFNNLASPRNANLILVLPFIFFLVPYLLFSLFQLKRVENKMQIVPRCLRDVVDNVESGRDLISSIRGTVNNEYGVLNEDITKLANQLSWGISFEDALINFAKNVESESLERDFRLVVEARRVGGHVEKILRELSEKITIENLRGKERKSNLASNTFTGYISFLIFIIIIVVVYNNLFVGLVAATGAESEAITQSNSLLLMFLSLFMLLAYEVAILSGFLFGLMQENNIIAGAPHVVILVLIVFVTFMFFIAI